ncbi:MAG: HAD family hydrolase, partial [Bacillota bacterium]
EPDVICGKPFQVMGEAILNRYHVSPAEIVMVGDRPHTDIRFGKNNGFHTILVLSGETDAHKAETLPESDTPDVVLQSLNDVVGEL